MGPGCLGDMALLIHLEFESPSRDVGAEFAFAPQVRQSTHGRALGATKRPFAALAQVPNDTPYSCIDSPSARSPQSDCILGDVKATGTIVLFVTPCVAVDTRSGERGDVARLETRDLHHGSCPVEDVSATIPALDETS